MWNLWKGVETDGDIECTYEEEIYPMEFQCDNCGTKTGNEYNVKKHTRGMHWLQILNVMNVEWWLNLKEEVDAREEPGLVNILYWATWRELCYLAFW